VPGYDFLSLGATDFELLVCDVLNAELGLHLRSFPEGRDGGIDLREVAEDGRVIVGQCKHYARTGKAKFLEVVRVEVDKPGYRNADRYLLATTHPTSPDVEAELAKILQIPISDVWGPTVLNDALRRRPEIARNHFKLWLSSTAMLERVVHAGLWNRTDALIEDIADEARLWVETPAYVEARETLGREAICIITGLPGAGKTFLADRLVLDGVSAEWQVAKITDGPRDAWDLWDPQVKQLFYFDDFLGQARLKLNAVDQASDLLDLMTRVRRHRSHKRLIMTSREQVVREATQVGSDRLEEVALHPWRCAITLQEMDTATKIEMLATHLFFSELPDDERERSRTDRRLISLAGHSAYNPRVIHEVVQRVREGNTADNVLEELAETFADPQKLWRTSFTPLPPPVQEILLTLATLPLRPVKLAELRVLADFTGSVLEWHNALKSLEPTWVRIAEASLDKIALFANPGCRDYLLGVLDDTEHAEDRLDRLRRMDQLLNLAHAAGLIYPPGATSLTVSRTYLGRALVARRRELAGRTVSWSDEQLSRPQSRSAILCVLRDAATLLSVLGDTESNAWLVERLLELVGAKDGGSSLPTYDALTMARVLDSVAVENEDTRHQVQLDLIVAGLLGAHTSRDLLSYEDLPDAMRVREAHVVACQRAASIFATEHELLISSYTDPKVLVEEGQDLQARASWYGIELNLGDLLDRAAELAAEY
jgi:Restriction endonuclease